MTVSETACNVYFSGCAQLSSSKSAPPLLISARVQSWLHSSLFESMLESPGILSNNSPPLSPSKDANERLKLTPNQERDLHNLLQLWSLVRDSSRHSCCKDETRATVEKEEEIDINSYPTHNLERRVEKDEERPHYYKKFRTLHDKLDQRLLHIRSQLTSLGGGGRTAKALESVQNALNEIDWPTGSNFMSVKSCIKALATLDLVMVEVKNSFKELGVYNLVLFSVLDRLKSYSQLIKDRLDVEYGQIGNKQIPVDGYLDLIVWKDLFNLFDGLLHELSDIDGKGIPTIHRSQEFTSQHYLLLTTVATFLSSVTATTLQITAADSDDISVLSHAMNTLWLISLVFSTASAVFSLLIMTWHQSHVRQPDKSLPPWAHALLKNGPTLTLVAAVAAFSVGLCLLSFSLSGKSKHSTLAAAIPTIFAGTFAAIIFALTSRLLFEKWKDRISNTWEGLLDTLDTYFNGIIAIATLIMRQVKLPSIPRARNRHRDIELANTGVLSDHVVTSTVPLRTYDRRPYRVDSVSSDSSNLLSKSEANSNSDLNLSEHALLNDSEGKDITSKFENTLQFSPSGVFLVTYFSGVITIYVTKMLARSFFLQKTLELPRDDPVRQIIWKPSGDCLLVRTGRMIHIWDIKLLHINHEPLIEATSISTIIVAAQSASWIPDFAGFVCAVKNRVMTLSISGEILHSYDLGNRHIRDVSFYGDQNILCLTSPLLTDNDSETGTESAQVQIYSIASKSIQRQVDVYSDQTSLSVSYSTNTILLHGSKRAAQVFEMTSGGLVTLDDDKFKLSNGKSIGGKHEKDSWDSLNFFGKDSKLVIGVSGFEVTLFEQTYFRHKILHIFSTPNDDAKMKAPISFAASPSVPYMFAFGLEDGSIKVWSIQSDKSLIGSDPRVNRFDVHDRRNRFGESSVSVGRYLTLPPPVMARQ